MSIGQEKPTIPTCPQTQPIYSNIRLFYYHNKDDFMLYVQKVYRMYAFLHSKIKLIPVAILKYFSLVFKSDFPPPPLPHTNICIWDKFSSPPNTSHMCNNR